MNVTPKLVENELLRMPVGKDLQTCELHLLTHASNGTEAVLKNTEINKVQGASPSPSPSG